MHLNALKMPLIISTAKLFLEITITQVIEFWDSAPKILVEISKFQFNQVIDKYLCVFLSKIKYFLEMNYTQFDITQKK